VQEIELGRKIKLPTGPKHELSNDQGDNHRYERRDNGQPKLVRLHAGHFNTLLRAAERACQDHRENGRRNHARRLTLGWTPGIACLRHGPLSSPPSLNRNCLDEPRT
jgi:hypothetical protein